MTRKNTRWNTTPGHYHGHTLTRYEINSAAEETPCAQCGTPLYTGDTAYMQGGEAFCTPTCARQAAAYIQAVIETGKPPKRPD